MTSSIFIIGAGGLAGKAVFAPPFLITLLPACAIGALVAGVWLESGLPIWGTCFLLLLSASLLANYVWIYASFRWLSTYVADTPSPELIKYDLLFCLGAADLLLGMLFVASNILGFDSPIISAIQERIPAAGVIALLCFPFFSAIAGRILTRYDSRINPRAPRTAQYPMPPEFIAYFWLPITVYWLQAKHKQHKLQLAAAQ